MVERGANKIDYRKKIYKNKIKIKTKYFINVKGVRKKKKEKPNIRNK